MKDVTIGRSIPFFLEEVPSLEIIFNEDDYKLRLGLLAERLKKLGLSHAVIYGDREHFSNIEYFCGFDCRFEEALLVVDSAGKPAIIVGNEGLSPAFAIPFEIEVVLYQNFSLSGQPRDKLKDLSVILSELGIVKDSKVGLAGWKYFEKNHISADSLTSFVVPAYIVDEVREACGNVTDFTKEIIGLPDGLRMTVRTAKEIAWIESAGNRVAAVMQRMLKALKPGISEMELSIEGRAGLEANNVHPMINFGAEHVSIGLRSPDSRKLELGEVCGVCYSARGNLTSRVGVASYDENSVMPELKPHLDFYKKHWYATTRWLEAVSAGAGCGQLYDAVMDIIGAPEYGVTLNPTHYTGTDEWTNSSSYKGSECTINDGSHIQVDIIAARQNPAMTAICEDCVIIAGKSLRDALKKEYPDVYARIVQRQKVVRETLGIQIHDDVLPMSNLNFVQYPYMLNLNEVFTLR